jgi:predicted metal-binding protein
MQKALIVGCGAYMSHCHACPGDWKCYKAATLGDGEFKQPTQVIGFVRCECPGRATMPNVGLTIKASEMKPDVILLSTCTVKPRPACPYLKPEDLAASIREKTGIPVAMGTHAYA